MGSRIYEDILTPRRMEISNFMWASRQINPQIAYKQQIKPSPQFHKDEVVKSPKIQELLILIHEQQKTPVEKLEAQVRNILNEIGYNKKLKVIRWLGLVLAKICLKVSSGIYVNKSSILELKSQMGHCPVVFVPSHRSYADFILMSFMCFSQDIAIPAIAAGMDFHGMWGMGSVLRDTGAFFMRRSYNDDNLYWVTFKQYIYQIVTKGELPIEFFIEGTRSRSNKSLMPKYGLILMILKAFFLSQVTDILFVPISISYDRILEEKLFAFELLGIPKPKETTSGFFKSLGIIKEKYGSIYFNFATPISAKNFFGEKLDRSVHSLKSIHHQEITEDEKKQIPALAHEIVHTQQKNSVISTFNLIAMILYNNLIYGKKISIEEMIHELTWLKQIIETLGGFVPGGEMRSNIIAALQVHQNLVKLDENEKFAIISDKIVLDELDSKKLKGHALLEKTISFSVPLIMLQIYINPILHYIIDVAIVGTIVTSFKEKMCKDELFGHYHFLRSLFSQEFVTFSTREQMDFEAALKYCLHLDLLVMDSEGFYHLGNNKKLENLIVNSLDCFIFTYYMVCLQLLQVPSNVIDEKCILARVQHDIEKKINENTIFIHPYSLSLDSITNCLNSLTIQGILKKTRSKGAVMYEINEPRVVSIKTELEHYVCEDNCESVQMYLKNKL